MAFLSDVDYNYLQSVLLWMIIIFDMDTDEKYGRLCLYLTLIMCNFVLQVVPTIHICLNYLTFNLFFKIFIIQVQRVNKKKTREEDDYDAPKKDKKSEGEDKIVKFEL